MTDPFAMATTIQETLARVSAAVGDATRGLSDYERERALFALVNSYSLA